MRTRNILEISNFRLGARKDGALREDKLLSMRTLRNYDIIYTDGRLRVRKGYTRYNATELPAVATQLYVFTDMANNEHILAISNNKWYRIAGASAHTLLKDATATARRPIVQFGNRVFFGTDSAWYWTDSDSIGGVTKSYRVGIKKPDGTIRLDTTAQEGHVETPSNSNILIVSNEAVGNTKYAIKYVPISNITLNSVSLSVRRFEARQDLSGAFRIKMYTNDAGEPSDTLANKDATSSWNDVAKFNYGSWGYKIFAFPNSFELTSGTTYWIVVEADDAYYDNYYAVGGSADFYGALGIEYNPGIYKYGKTLQYHADLVPPTWGEVSSEVVFYIGGLGGDPEKVYDYVVTYKNEKYVIESRPSDAARISVGLTKPVVFVADYPHTTETQVDKVKIYRRDVPAMESIESAITDTYKLVTEVDYNYAFFDSITSGYLGAELQTTDHYCYDDTDDSGEKIRTAALLPNLACVWKSRIWFAESTGNILYMSKKLEEDGSTGLVGDEIPDYYPLENRLEIPEASAIIALKLMSQDQLIVYFKNGAIWGLWGTNEVLNPPSDIIMRPVLNAGGLIAPGGVDSYFGMHIIMTRDGLYAFDGSPNMAHLSETNASIFDAIQTGYLDDTIVAVAGHEIWVLVDDDNDGVRETILILDMRRDLQTRQLYDRAWRSYQYDVGLNDIASYTSGNYQTILAADAVNKYILKLQDGTTDNGKPITAFIETHDMPMVDVVAITGVGLRATYVRNPASYKITLTDHIGREYLFGLSPSSSEDVTGHRTGCLASSPVTMRAQIEQMAVAQDELMGTWFETLVEQGR